MAIDEKKCVEVIIKTGDPVVRPVVLKDVGFLQKESTFVNCPACEAEAKSVVRLEIVTCWQRFINFTNLCKNWHGRHDINHYCGKCGCFIGRYVPIGCSERCLSRSARKQAAVDDMTLKAKPKDCAVTMQKKREHFKAARAQERAAKEEVAKQAQQQQDGNDVAAAK